jgi:hypothetical protein
LCDVNQYALHLPLERKRKPGRPKLLSGSLARQAEELQKQREPVIIDLSSHAPTDDSDSKGRVTRKKTKNKEDNQVSSSKGLKRKLSTAARCSKKSKN